MATTDAEVARARVAELDWWHTIEVAPGVVTPGGWDLRPTAERLPWPTSLAGLGCLAIGTVVGFWGFVARAPGGERGDSQRRARRDAARPLRRRSTARQAAPAPLRAQLCA